MSGEPIVVTCPHCDGLGVAKVAAQAPEGLEAMARRIADKTYTGGNLAFRETLYQDILNALRAAASDEPAREDA